MTSLTSSEALREQGCGRRLGRYTILRRLAQGGMAEVYLGRAIDASGRGRLVAIKKILPQFSHNQRFIEMLKDEAQITVSLTHPNIAQVLELGRSGDDYFLAMEYVPGRPLNKLMQRADEERLMCIPVPHAAYVMSEIAKGLDHAHRQPDGRGHNLNIVHRDVSPQNVLISYAGAVKLIDFGIARAEGRVNRTHHGVIKGKLRYLAPEIASGREPDHRADIFCCGIVLFEMLTGEAMFAPRSDQEAIEMASQAKVKSPRSRNAKVPEALDTIVMRALRRDRSDRYASAYDLYAALIAFLRDYDPGYEEGALGRFMRRLFAADIEIDLALDEAALAVVDAEPGFSEEPTLASVSDDAPYEQLVTRTEIPADEATLAGQPMVMVGGADGGEAMAVIPADDTPPVDDTPPAPAQRSAYTMPPIGASPHDTMPAPVRSASSPPDRAGYTQPPVGDVLEKTASFNELEATEKERPARRERVPPSVRRLAFVPTSVHGYGWWSVEGVSLIMIIATVLVGLAFGLARLTQSPVVIQPAVSVTRVQPVEPAVEPRRPSTPANQEPADDSPPAPIPAVLTLVIEPDVPVTIRIDGRIQHRDATTPAVFSGIAPHRIHRIVISAEGFEDLTFSRVLRPGEKRTIELTLSPVKGTIRVVGATGSIRASLGRVVGDRIVDVPLGRPVMVTAGRVGARPYRRQLTLRSPTEVRITVPQRRRRGVLQVTSRPQSTVYVDGKRRGQTPLSLRLRAGQHRIVLKSPSGQTLSVVRSVKAGKTTSFVYRWPR